MRDSISGRLPLEDRKKMSRKAFTLKGSIRLSETGFEVLEVGVCYERRAKERRLVKFRLSPPLCGRLPRSLPEPDCMSTGATTMRALRILLLIAALLGLTGQATAMAAEPLAAASSMAASAMSEDCMEMMGDTEQPEPLQCDGSFKCMLAMGCLSLNAMAPLSGASIAGQAEPTQGYWPATAILLGASVAPEPHPPATFG